MSRVVAGLISLFMLVSWARAGDEGIAGNWKVTILEDGSQVSFWLLHLESKGGKLSGTVESIAKIPPTRLEEAKTSGDLLLFTLRIKNGPVFTFEGKLPRAGAKKIFGSLARAGQMIPAILEATPAQNPAELDREILMRTPNDPRVFAAALSMIRNAKDNKATAKDAQEWAEIALRSGELYGPRWQLDVALKLIDALVEQEGFGAAAVETARKAEKLLDASAPLDARLRVLTALGDALRRAGQPDQAKEVDGRLDKLEDDAYQAYAAKSLDFKLEKFPGRKAKSNRAALVELFTGAQCPPCVGADLGFDALSKAYAPSDVVLLQYHLHIPGPDALTNGDCEARAEFYDDKIRGTPSIFFSGKVATIGGGSREEAPDLFQEYQRVANPILETPTAVQVQASALRKGDKVEIKATVTDLDKPGEKVKLRFALVEDWVRYKGRNGLTYHHRVVRAFPGGAAGFALPNRVAGHSAVVDLGELRQKLTKYLDDYARAEVPFLDSQRPMRLRNLSVVAFVQDDATQEVLQAVNVPVKE
ncbi:MAG: hypothetical protein L0215_09945 [Gemmataceae bacterium]|nr:hypothetical protein [Gemmataceae bacterium]